MTLNRWRQLLIVMKSVACIWRAWAWIRWVGGWCDRRAQIEDIWAARHALLPLRHQLRPQSATGCQQTTSQISPSDQTGFPKNSTVIFYVIMHLCDMREREKIKINEGRISLRDTKICIPCLPFYIMWKLFEGKGRCVVFILFKINNVFHVRLWFVLLPKQLLSVSFCGWFTVALTFATKQLYIISTVRKFPIPSIPIKET